jgi:hypothetical protein
VSRRFILLAGLTAVTTLAFPVVAAGGVPTFTKDVAPILFRNCAHCHRPADIAAMAPFLSYDTVRPWARAIKDKILLHEMPPWPADPALSLKFRNDARLKQRDIDTLVAWVDAGAPKGNDADLPPTPEFVEGWLHPQGLKPDLVISLPGEFQAPAKGEIPYVRLLAKVVLPEDKWVAASQVRPGNPALVHHIAITEVALDSGMTPSDLGPIELLARQMGLPRGATSARPAVTAPSHPAVFDMLGVYTPGSTFEMYGDDNAKLLRGGQNFYLNFNIHYQTTGKPERDRSMIGFWFRQTPPKRQLFRVPGAGDTIVVNGKELLNDTPGIKAEGTDVAIPPIPPRAENFEVTGMTAYSEPVTIYQFQPHAHLRAKDFKYTVVYPDGREQPVLSVPKCDFRWQLAYELETPLQLPPGSKMVVTAHYDNSLNNKYNPAPDKEVYFRAQNQSWDEMFTPFIQYTIDSQDLTAKTVPAQALERSGRDVVEIAEVIGCLEQNPSSAWKLTHASDAVVSTTPSTTSAALKAARTIPLGHREYQLIGVSVFAPSSHKGHKVAVKGLLNPDLKDGRLNVTSLQLVAEACAN